MRTSDLNPGNSPKAMNDAGVREPHDVTRITLQVLFIGILISAVAWIIRPFVTSIIWAAMIVVTTWPILLSLQTRLKGRRLLAAAIMIAALMLVVIVPILLAVAAIIIRADDAYFWAKSLSTLTMPAPPEWIGGIPLIGKRVVDLWNKLAQAGGEEFVSYLTPYARQTFRWFVGRAGSVGIVVIQFFLTVIAAAILYAKGEAATTGIGAFARRLAGREGVGAVHLAGKAIRGVALGVVVTAIIQTAIGGIGLAVAGVPAPALLTAVMFMLCLAQIGPALVLVPAVIWLYWSGGALWGTVLLVFTVPAMVLDNIIRPVLIKKGSDIPLILIFAGVIGGLIAFGIIGLFIGPVVLAVAHTLLTAWVSGGLEEEKPAISKKE